MMKSKFTEEQIAFSLHVLIICKPSLKKHHEWPEFN
jgi:hypothetical protein